ncbi:4-(cytidine 5'-diphospho)-2-C-methyl-D-erythritol kinase [Rhodobacterales bacterium]|nr:4-(cytidine 5'-diphospho)-2-C-methyl-D-erythritol kinase [Rhodobacterales bacterium]
MVSGSAPASRAELARAKVNLALHITGQRSDGYHLLASLVVFPQIGDRVALQPDEAFKLVLDGPFARDLEGPSNDNLIVKAVKAFAEAASIEIPDVALTLTKRLPVSSGIGGGSTDAATALRLLEDFTEVYLPDDELHALALKLGADVPVCLYSDPQIMRGIGDELEPAPAMPACAMLLVNPKVGVSTPDVFKALAGKTNEALPATPEAFDSLADLTAYLESCRNDMQAAAIGLCPEIGDVLAALQSDERIVLTRMSGSGATCFGLCEKSAAMDIERDLRKAHPEWWIASGPLG